VLKQELDHSFEELERMLTKMEGNEEAVSQLHEAKGNVDSAHESIAWYTDDIANLNTKYMDLKNAYDALDIEYAQLYEKQNQLEAASRG